MDGRSVHTAMHDNLLFVALHTSVIRSQRYTLATEKRYL